jgi:8-hydroxy-5-deazaflavin:NADPH oxidoreductase
MKIGVLGSGDVAKALGSGFLKHGHEVVMGTRSPEKLVDWKTQNPNGSIDTFDAAAASAEIIVLAVKGTAAADALRLAGAEHLAEKTIIDATNPIADAPPDHGVLQFFTDRNDSLMEQLQQEFSTAKFVKAFNSVGAASMVNPQFKSGKPTMFICGNDETAKESVRTILEAFGWETADMGVVEAARAVEPLSMLWCIPGFLSNQWTHAFKLLTLE